MLSVEENELLTRVGPGTPMGDLLRQYWLPALLSEELPERDGRPLRVRLLGEDLIAFRDADGSVGLLANNCAHRGASLFFGRNEEAGLRCVYHGWKFDVTGRCVDMPNEPPESNFKDKVRQRAYPCAERQGIVWAYLGPREAPPPLPQYEFGLVPAGQRWAQPFVRECNWLQALEGDIDSAHSSFLHSVLDRKDIGDLGTGLKHVDRHPRFEVLDTDFGVTIAARRTPDDDRYYYWRLTQFLFPIVTYFPPTGEQMETVPGHIWVPIDDGTTLVWSLRWHPQKAMGNDASGESAIRRRPGAAFDGPEEYLPPTTEPAGRWRFKANRRNDYLLDYEAQQTRRFSGIPTIPLQDQAMTESMGSVMDRTVEHLGSTDAGIIRVRHALARAALALRDEGRTPPGVDRPEVLRVRSASGLLPVDVNWIEGTQEWVKARPDAPVVSA